MIIPIGIQCLNATLKKRINKDLKHYHLIDVLHPKFVMKF